MSHLVGSVEYEGESDDLCVVLYACASLVSAVVGVVNVEYQGDEVVQSGGAVGVRLWWEYVVAEVHPGGVS